MRPHDTSKADKYLKCPNCKERDVELVWCEELKKWICDACADGVEIESEEKKDKLFSQRCL